MKIIHLTDPHLVSPGGFLHGFDPAPRLRRVIETINADHSDADLCVVTGDLADGGEETGYHLLRDILSDLRVPVRLLVGNHDDRATLRRVFPNLPADPQGFLQWSEDVVEGRLIFLDTLQDGEGYGSLRGGRLEWLEAQLADATGDVYIFAHHPLQPIGLPHFDPMNMREWRDVMRVVTDSGKVRHIFCGHVHVDTSGSWSGVPFSASRGVAHQIIPHLSRRDARFTEDAPAFDIAQIGPDGVLVHHIELGDREIAAISPEEFDPELKS